MSFQVFMPEKTTGFWNTSQQHPVTAFCKHWFMDTVGSRIKARRKELRMSRKELCRLTGIGYSSVAEIERAGQKSTTRLHLYAKALGVTESWLATGKGLKLAAFLWAHENNYRILLTS